MVVVRGQPLCHDWSADPWSKGTWMAVRAGRAGAVGRASRAAAAPWGAKGRGECGCLLLVAGADLAPGWVGWMEGACETGAARAGEVDAFLHSGESR